ncbi:hypothetical protein U3516DRAFT_654846 [Neocallimastix sp. 'constans']
MKNEIRKTSISFNINPKHIYNEKSEEIGLICPEYNSIKSQISRYIKKQLFMKLFIKYNENMFADGTFYIAPILGYQVFITRIFAPEINSFYITSLSILNNEEQATYELLFEELKKNAI